MKGPLTRRRERRILEALETLGPLDDLDLATFLGTHRTLLKKPLLNLARDKQITVSRPPSILNSYFIWSIPNQDNSDE